jgi:hypothetical protein
MATLALKVGFLKKCILSSGITKNKDLFGVDEVGIGFGLGFLLPTQYRFLIARPLATRSILVMVLSILLFFDLMEILPCHSLNQTHFCSKHQTHVVRICSDSGARVFSSILL